MIPPSIVSNSHKLQSIRLGRVKFFDHKKNHFGYLSELSLGGTGAGGEIRIEQSDLNCSLPLEDGTMVVFEIDSNPKGRKAIKVRRFEDCSEAEKVQLLPFLPHFDQTKLGKALLDSGVGLDESARRSLRQAASETIDRTGWEILRALGTQEEIDAFVKQVAEGIDSNKMMILGDDYEAQVFPSAKRPAPIDQTLFLKIVEGWRFENRFVTDKLLDKLDYAKVNVEETPQFAQSAKGHLRELPEHAQIRLLRYLKDINLLKEWLSGVQIQSDTAWAGIVTVVTKEPFLSDSANLWQSLLQDICKQPSKISANLRATVSKAVLEQLGLDAWQTYCKESVREAASRGVDIAFGLIESFEHADLPRELKNSFGMHLRRELLSVAKSNGERLLIAKRHGCEAMLPEVLGSWECNVNPGLDRSLLAMISQLPNRESLSEMIISLIDKMETTAHSLSVLRILSATGLRDRFLKYPIVYSLLLDSSTTSHSTMLESLSKELDTVSVSAYVRTYCELDVERSQTEWVTLIRLIKNDWRAYVSKETAHTVKERLLGYISRGKLMDVNRLEILDATDNVDIAEQIILGWSGESSIDANQALLKDIASRHDYEFTDGVINTLIRRLSGKVDSKELIEFVVFRSGGKFWYDNLRALSEIPCWFDGFIDLIRSNPKFRQTIFGITSSSEEFSDQKTFLNFLTSHLEDNYFGDFQTIKDQLEGQAKEAQLLFLKRAIQKFYFKKIEGNQLRELIEGINWTNLSCKIIIAFLHNARNERIDLQKEINTVFKEHLNTLSEIENRTGELERHFDLSTLVKPCDGRKGYAEQKTQTRYNRPTRVSENSPGIVYDSATGTFRFSKPFRLFVGNKENFLCEGRFWKRKQFIDDLTGLPTKEEYDYFWCRGHMCMGVNQSSKMDLPFREWTLYEIAEVFHFEVDRLTYSFLAGWVNRVNEIVGRLRCRSCDSVLRPKPFVPKTLGFYALPLFQCLKEGCSEFEKAIRITHCLNGKCRRILDSRDNKTCTNGWLVCECKTCCPKHSGRKFDPIVVEEPNWNA